MLHYALRDWWEEAHPLLGAVRALAGAVEQFDDAAARALGVGRSDLRALNLLEGGPLPSGVLAARLGLSSGAATALVDRLVAAGFATRQAAPDDGRKVLVGLQPAVRQAFARVYGPCGAAVASVGEAAPQEATVAEQVLAQVAAAVRREAAGLEG